MWEKILARTATIEALEDNEATMQITRTGKNPSLRHISRVNGVSIALLHDLLQQNGITAKYQHTGGRKADNFYQDVKRGLLGTLSDPSLASVHLSCRVVVTPSVGVR